ncbi:bifunctional diaminohydroxyphosphoribosylaminopyrimidine deaminase/5-amino-6-(5-phosphoribosylamino)uracil reductase RibD [Singulisphaera sp. PoT]|uniref:bifunctional diaminohydroxyphosphoribosylaminopyrimidine deaminase/5-amino-6-(5-phosphoribosylamino)uracil reductase RibD n=1 Tax=Singulisphaera sp. PoT TaxID=3411797 RepID=UPI003BF59A3C
MSGEDLIWMRRALAEAEFGRGYVEPNPMVGAVVTRDGQLISAGYHGRFGGPHAEVEALRRAGGQARGATLYVTLEPCCHTGKTPPCADAVIASGITRVVVAMRDPFPKVAGGGLSRLRESGIEVEVGLESEAAQRLNAPYLKLLSTGRPYITAKWAMTLDGKTATASGDSRWISNARSRSMVHELRGRMDAIVVGIGTAIADDPRLTARPQGPRVATRVILDSEARLSPDSQLARTASEIQVIVAVTERAPEERKRILADLGCEILAFAGNGSVPVEELLDELGRRRMTNVMIEGGGRVLGAFLDRNEVDAVDIYIAPIVEGGAPAFTPASGAGHALMSQTRRLERHTTSLIGADIRIQGIFTPAWRKGE